MAMTEEARHELYEALKEQLGRAPAATLMEAIPPVGWADVATKQDIVLLKSDLVQLEERIDLRLDLLKAEFRTEMQALRADVNERIVDLQRNLFLGMLGSQAAFASIVVAALIIVR